MILQKFSDAIREQNWFAVILEILIVVVGIFIGLQVDEWNQTRLENQRARQALEDLQAEFVVIGRAANGLAEYYRDLIGDLELLNDSLAAGEIKAKDEASIRDAIAFGGNFGDPPPPSGTFLDLMSSGDLELIQNRELRLRLIEYDQSLDVIVESDANINNMLGHFAFAFRQHATIGGTFQLPDASNFAFVEMKFPSATKVNFDAILTDPAFRVAAEQHLSSQLSRFINIAVSRSKIDQIQDLIDQELGVGAISAGDSR